MAKVSIIMPVYGVERYIARAIESVINQTHEDWELIVVNDGSPDKSREKAEMYSDIDSRIRIVDKPNGGLSDARNFGLRYATGEYVNFFDSDDWIECDYLENLLKPFKQQDIDLTICGYYVDSEDKSGVLNNRIKRSEIISSPTNASEYLNLIENYLNYAWNKLYRLKFLKDNELLFEKGLWFIEDAEFIHRVFQHTPGISYIDYAGYHYVQRTEETLSKKFNFQITEFFKRKLTFYNPIVKALGGKQKIIDDIVKDMRAYCTVYLIKKVLQNYEDSLFRQSISELNSDSVLSPSLSSLRRCKGTKDKLILLSAKLNMLYILKKVLK